MIFIHIESILNVNEFNYNLPNYCIKERITLAKVENKTDLAKKTQFIMSCT